MASLFLYAHCIEGLWVIDIVDVSNAAQW